MLSVFGSTVLLKLVLSGFQQDGTVLSINLINCETKNTLAYLTMSPSTITLSKRGFPGSAGRTGKISCAWRIRCLLHTFIIWFWNRISISTNSCYKAKQTVFQQQLFKVSNWYCTSLYIWYWTKKTRFKNRNMKWCKNTV